MRPGRTITVRCTNLPPGNGVAQVAISSVAERTIYMSFIVALLIVLVVCISVWWFGPFRVRAGADSPPEQRDGRGPDAR